MTLDISRLERVRPGPNGSTIARCPACAEEGRDAAGNHLQIRADGRFGCTVNEGDQGRTHRQRIWKLVGMNPTRTFALTGPGRLLPPPNDAQLTKRTMPAPAFTDASALVAHLSSKLGPCTGRWPYETGDSQTLFEVARFDGPDGKTYRPLKHGPDGWRPGLPDGPLPPFALPVLMQSGEAPVYVVEGEKCAAAMLELGLVATCTVGGAKNAGRTDLSLLAGRDVRILPGQTADALAATIEAAALETPAEVADDDHRLISLVALAQQPIDWSETLIGQDECRYLERGAVLMLAAPSGVGKSHIAAQAAISWACGRPAFCLPPSRPLRCLIVQAENPPNDSRTIAANMLRGLSLTPEEVALVDANTRQLWLPGCTGETFVSQLRSTLATWRADVVFMDPLSGFADGDLTKPETVQRFCRYHLNSLAVEHRCALFICHHVPKPNAARDPSKLGVYDHQYVGSGSADLVANWPRAVLTLQAIERGQFILRAAKRRPPWLTEDQRQLWEIGLRHTSAGTWQSHEVDLQTVRTGRPKPADPATFKDAVLEFFAKSGPMPKTVAEGRLMAHVTSTRAPTRAVLAMLVADESLVSWRGKGKGGPNMVGLPSQVPMEAPPAGTPPTSPDGDIGEVGEVGEVTEVASN